jgi:ribosomal protein S18 acetylase RimI-like enzyme
MSTRVISVDDPDDVVDVLCEAFHDYPVMRFVLGSGRPDYDRDLRTLVGLFVMSRALRGEYLFGVRTEDRRLEAAAIVSRPGTSGPPALAALREEVWAALGGESRARYEAFVAACAPLEPTGPHLHLNMIGVRRGAQRSGRARLLLDHVHALSRDDPESGGVSLSTENPRNVALYEHVGYVVRGHAIVSPELETWALYRPG